MPHFGFHNQEDVLGLVVRGVQGVGRSAVVASDAQGRFAVLCRLLRVPVCWLFVHVAPCSGCGGCGRSSNIYHRKGHSVSRGSKPAWISRLLLSTQRWTTATALCSCTLNTRSNKRTSGAALTCDPRRTKAHRPKTHKTERKGACRARCCLGILLVRYNSASSAL